jgi:hypothetical protein
MASRPGIESKENWFEYRLEHDPPFLRRIEQAYDQLCHEKAIDAPRTSTDGGANPQLANFQFAATWAEPGCVDRRREYGGFF